MLFTSFKEIFKDTEYLWRREIEIVISALCLLNAGA